MADPKKKDSKVISYSNWEKTYILTEDEQNYLATLEGKNIQNPFLQQKKLLQIDNSKPANELVPCKITENPIKNYEFLYEESASEADKKIKELEKLRNSFSNAMILLNNLVESTKKFMINVRELETVKTQIVQQIDEFYFESNRIILKQQLMVELASSFESNISYYEVLDKIERYVNTLPDNISINNFHLYLEVFGRYLNELIDCSVFFLERPAYYQSAIQLKKIQTLKQKVLYIIKTLSLKILTRHIKYYEIFVGSVNYKNLSQYFMNSSSAEEGLKSKDWNEKKKTFILFFVWGLHPEFNEIISKVIIRDKLTAGELIDFCWSLAKKEVKIGNHTDQPVAQFYKDHKETITTFWNIQQQEEVDILDSKLMNKFFYIINTLKNLSSADIEIAKMYINIKETFYLTSRQNLNTKLIAFIKKPYTSENQSLDNLITIFHLITFCEFFIQSLIFSPKLTGHFTLDEIDIGSLLSDIKVKQYLQVLNDKIIEELRFFIVREKTVEVLVREYDSIKKNISSHFELEGFLLISWIFGIQKSTPLYASAFLPHFIEHIKKILDEVSQRLVFLTQFNHQQNISNFNLKVSFPQQHPLSIPVSNTLEKYKEFVALNYHDKVLSPLKNAYNICYTLNGRVDPEVFQQIACESFNSCIEIIVNASRLLDDRFDQFLFLTKHFYNILFI